ncbi:hypothetical protein TKK_0003867 [Trichogramma kaykai]
MESNGSFNGAIRIKEEPIEVSLTENNDYETIDKEPNSNNVQSSRFRDNSQFTLKHKLRAHMRNMHVICSR